MKRESKLFDQVFAKENLYKAYLGARRGKRNKRACFDFELTLGSQINRLYDEIHGGTFRPKPYFHFTVHEPKERLIRAPAFRDVVVQHAIYRYIYPIFDRSFISTSFACRVGYGTYKASDYLQYALRQYNGDLYSLKLDVRKFFYSIDRAILQSLIERKIDDIRLVNLMMFFTETEEPLGIPIGNLLSQIFALVYLNPVDHFIKRELKIKHYLRYVDDMVLVGLARDRCIETRDRIRAFLADKLHLGLSKTTILPIRRGVNFAGYRTWRSKRFIRKYSLHKFNRKVQEGKIDAVISLLGHAKNTNSLPHMVRTIKQNGRWLDIPAKLRRSLPS